MATAHMAYQNVWQALTALALAAFLLLLWRISRIGRRLKDLPPGPPTVPVVGNMHQMPGEKRHLQFGKWAEEYGPIYSLMLGTQTYVVLSADYAIRDLVDKRGAIYASRPDLYIAQHIVSGGLRVLFMVRLPSTRIVPHCLVPNPANNDLTRAHRRRARPGRWSGSLRIAS